MNKMFCFQCEQTAMSTGCTGNAGVCGKKSDTANLQDKLTGALIGLACAVKKSSANATTDKLMLSGLFTTITNVNFNNETINELTEEITKEKVKLSNTCLD